MTPSTALTNTAPALLAYCQRLKAYLDGVGVGCTPSPAMQFELYHELTAVIIAATGTTVTDMDAVSETVARLINTTKQDG